MPDRPMLYPPITRPVLDYPCGDAPDPGFAKEVAHGLFWLRMPLPFALDHINLWAARDGKGWAIFDSGVKNDETAAAWESLLGNDGALAGGPTRVLVTHMHPDHVGMAGWLTRRFDCRLWMTRLEYLSCRSLVADTGRSAPDDGVNFYRRAGWNDAAIERYRSRFGGFGQQTHALPDSYRRLKDAEEIRIGDHTWKVVVGNGHSPEHACFYSPDHRVLISGDQVLPRISSNVSVFPTEPDADPMNDWLQSLDKLRREVPDDVLVLPAHNEPFRGLHARLDYLAASQHQAIDRLREALATPKRAVDVFPQLFSRPIEANSELLGMATGESIAHLNYLLHRDEAVRETDAQGIAWYCMKAG